MDVRTIRTLGTVLIFSSMLPSHMSVLDTVKELFSGPSSKPPSESTGAYWCHDCNERIPETDVAGNEDPSCPSCGEAMDFERSSAASCAC